MQKVPLIRIIVDFVILGLLWLPIPIIWVHLQPFQRGFFCSDTSIRYPFKQGTVSSATLYSVGCLLPTVSILVVEAYRVYFLEPRAFHGGLPLKPRYTVFGVSVSPYLASLYIYLGYFCFGMALTILLTDFGKYSVGRLRPHFLDVCKPNLTLYCADQYAYVQPEHVHCTASSDKVRAARLSFPSGHASFSTYTMVYLTLYLQSRMIWPVGGLLFKHLLQVVALFLAVATSISRISDFKHHWSDVLSGSIVGAAVAIIVAYSVLGLFRRPQNVFARSAPYDSRQYSGGQLYSDFSEDVNAAEPLMITLEGKKEVAVSASPRNVGS